MGLQGRGEISRDLANTRRQLNTFKRQVERDGRKTPVAGIGTKQSRTKEQRLALKGINDIGRAAIRINERIENQKVASVRRLARFQVRAEVQAAKKAARERESINRRVSQANRRRIGSDLRGTGRLARRGLGVAVAGAGIIAGASIRDQVRSEGSIADVVNQVAGNKGENRNRLEIFTDLKKLINEQSERTGFSREELTGGIRAGIASTGNLRQFEEQVPFLSDLARTASAEFMDVGQAAGQVFLELNKTLGEAEGAKQFQKAMLALAGQSKQGSIEMADLAKEVGGLVSSAGQFEGEVGDLIATMGAFGQLAKAGGAKSSPEAITAVARIPSDIVGHVKQLKDIGVDATVKGGTALKDPLSILIDTLKATGGKLEPIRGIFQQRSFKAFLPLQQAFAKATGGKTDEESLEKGAKAARELVENLSKGAKLTKGDLTKATQFRNEQVDVQLTRSWNQIKNAFGEEFLPVLKTEIIPTIKNDLAPALAEAAPHMAMFLRQLLELVSWLGDNPFEAATLAMTAVVAKTTASAVTGSFASAGIGLGARGAIVSSLANAGIGIAVAAAISNLIKQAEINKQQNELQVESARIARDVEKGTISEEDARKRLSDLWMKSKQYEENRSTFRGRIARATQFNADVSFEDVAKSTAAGFAANPIVGPAIGLASAFFGEDAENENKKISRAYENQDIAAKEVVKENQQQKFEEFQKQSTEKFLNSLSGFDEAIGVFKQASETQLAAAGQKMSTTRVEPRTERP